MARVPVDWTEGPSQARPPAVILVLASTKKLKGNNVNYTDRTHACFILATTH